MRIIREENARGYPDSADLARAPTGPIVVLRNGPLRERKRLACRF